MYSYPQLTPSLIISAGICQLLSMPVHAALNYRLPHVVIIVPVQCTRVLPSTVSVPCFLKYGTWVPRGCFRGLRWGLMSPLGSLLTLPFSFTYISLPPLQSSRITISIVVILSLVLLFSLDLSCLLPPRFLSLSNILS